MKKFTMKLDWGYTLLLLGLIGTIWLLTGIFHP